MNQYLSKPGAIYSPGWGFFLTLFFALIFAILFSHAMLTTLNHDEYQFVAGGQLLAARGLLPYRDYPFLHMPYMLWVNGLVFKVTSYDFLAARLLTALFGLLSAGLVFLNVFRCSSHAPRAFRHLLSCAAVFLFVTNSAYLDANGRALNHAVPSLLSLLAFEVFSQRRAEKGRWLHFLLVGSLTGLAMGTRLTYAMLIPAFTVAILFMPLNDPAYKESPQLGHVLRNLFSFASGIGIALLPVSLLAVIAPRQFLFGNFVYIHLNTGYRQAVGYGEAMTLAGKLVYFVQNVLSQPVNLLLYALALGLGILAIASWAKHKDHRSLPGALVSLLSLCLFISAFGPTPTWSQYFFAPLPFLVIGSAWMVIGFQQQSSRLGWGLLGLILVLALLSSIRNDAFREVTSLREPQTWVPNQVHRFADQIKEVLPEGKVLTLAPIFPLEAGLDTCEMFTVGPLVWRSAHILSQDKRQAYQIIALTELDAYLQDQPPDAILLGLEDRYDGFWAENPGTLEIPLREVAEANGYVPIELTPGFGEGREILWVK